MRTGSSAEVCSGGSTPERLEQRHTEPGEESPVTVWAGSFLTWCRIEKGLAPATLEAYSEDLRRFAAFCPPSGAEDSEMVHRYVDSLYAAGLSGRSIARHLTTLRNFYTFLLQEGKIQRDPVHLMTLPRQWS